MSVSNSAVGSLWHNLGSWKSKRKGFSYLCTCNSVALTHRPRDPAFGQDTVAANPGIHTHMIKCFIAAFFVTRTVETTLRAKNIKKLPLLPRFCSSTKSQDLPFDSRQLSTKTSTSTSNGFGTSSGGRHPASAQMVAEPEPPSSSPMTLWKPSSSYGVQLRQLALILVRFKRSKERWEKSERGRLKGEREKTIKTEQTNIKTRWNNIASNQKVNMSRLTYSKHGHSPKQTPWWASSPFQPLVLVNRTCRKNSKQPLLKRIQFLSLENLQWKSVSRWVSEFQKRLKAVRILDSYLRIVCLIKNRKKCNLRNVSSWWTWSVACSLAFRISMLHFLVFFFHQTVPLVKPSCTFVSAMTCGYYVHDMVMSYDL